jgi:endo-1,4-beta-xylanase
MKNGITFLSGWAIVLILAACGLAPAVSTNTPTAEATAETTATDAVTNTPAPDCSGGYIALTFDDGPFAGQTEQLISALEAAHLRATFFDLGSHLAGNEALVKAQAAIGWMGNHSWSHADLTQVDEAGITTELKDTQKALQEITGETPILFRPPFLKSNGTLRGVESNLGMTEVMTNIDSKDWASIPTGEIVKNVSAAYGGAVVLMHDNLGATRAAIPQVAAFMLEKKLCPGRIDPVTGQAVAP